MYSEITGYAWWNWTISGVQIAVGLALCLTGVGSVAGVSLLFASVSMLASNSMSALGMDDKLSMQIQSGLNLVAGISLSFVPGMGGIGASLIGSGIVGFAGGYISEALGGSYALGWAIGNVVGGIAVGMIYKNIIGKLNTPGNMIKSFESHPSRWKIVNQISEVATGRNYRGGVSIYTTYKNIYTGGILGTHIITRAEKILHGLHYFF